MPKKPYKPSPWRNLKMPLRTEQEVQGRSILAMAEGMKGPLLTGPPSVRVRHKCGGVVAC